MKKKLALIAPVLLIVASGVMADDCGFTPYMGLDAQLRYTGFKSGFGNNLFNHNLPQGNAYVGLKFNDCIGIEVGVSGGPKRSQSATLNAGDNNLGTLLIGELIQDTPLTYNTTTQTRSAHVSVVGFYPLTCDLQAYASLGGARVRAHYTRLAVFSGTESLIGQPLSTEHFAKSKTVLRVGLGLQQMLSCNVGVRAGAIWENTSRLNNITGRSAQLFTPGNPMPIVKVKDSFIYNLGIFWLF